MAFFGLVTWWRWTKPNLKRDPDTLLGVWSLLAASGCPSSSGTGGGVNSARADFEDLGTAGRAELVSRVKSWRKGYVLREVVGQDGVVRMGIVEDKALGDVREGFETVRGQASTGRVAEVGYGTIGVGAGRENGDDELPQMQMGATPLLARS